MYSKKDEAEIQKALKELKKGNPPDHMKSHLYDEAKRRFSGVNKESGLGKDRKNANITMKKKI